jgi:hypothetical protein
MNRLKVAALALGIAAAAAAQARTEWLTKEFKDNWDAPGQGAEEFLNGQCQPSGFDGIQVFAVQKGHGSTFNLHLSCRVDKRSKTHYTVRMIDVPRGKLDSVFVPYLDNPNARIGPFYFGKVDAPDGTDGLILIEKTR